MNKITLTGNLVKDSELQSIGDKGTPKLSFTLANNEGYGDNKKAIFVNCVLWGKSGESLSKYLVKGTKVLLNGKLDIRKYKDKEGNDKWLTEVIVDMFGGVEFIGGNKEKSNNNSNNVWDGMEPFDEGDMPF